MESTAPSSSSDNFFSDKVLSENDGVWFDGVLSENDNVFFFTAFCLRMKPFRLSLMTFGLRPDAFSFESDT